MLTDNQVLQGLEEIHRDLGGILHISEKYLGENLVAEISVIGTELVNQIFSHSDKSYIMIRDDLIIYSNQAFMDLVGIKEYEDIFKRSFYKFLASGNKAHLLKNMREMLVNDISIDLTLLREGVEVPSRFRAIYIEDASSLTYILIEE